MVDPDLLHLLCCPETRQPVHLADPDLLQRLNQKIAGGTLKNHNRQTISEPITAGLVRADGRILYPIRKDIPVMLVQEGIPLD